MVSAQRPTAAAWSPDLVREVAETLKHLEGPLLPILHAINDRFGYIDERAVPIVADVLNLSRADVHGVVTFYHDFRHAPAAKHLVKICRAEACQSLGGERLFQDVSKACKSRKDVTVEAVYCLGNCALSPAALVDGKLHGRLDTQKTLALVQG